MSISTMIILSNNLRGLCSLDKKKREVKEWVVKENVQFLALYESNLEVVNHLTYKALWGYI